MSRLTVAWVTSKPAVIRASTSSRWLPIGRAATSCRMTRWRVRFSSWPVERDRPCQAAPTAARTVVMRVPKRRVLERPLEGTVGGRVGDDRLRAVPAEGGERGPDLGHHAAGDDAAVDEVLRLGDGQAVELVAVGVADAVDIGQQDQLPRPEAGRDAGRGVIGVDVADDALGVAGERRDDRHLAADQDRVEQVAPQPGHAGHQPELRDPLGDEQAAVDAGQTDGIDPEVAQPRDQLAVDDAAQDRRGDLEALGVGHAQAALEGGRHAEPFEPLGDPLAAAVDEHDRSACAPTAATSGQHLASGPRSSCHRA